MGGISQNEEMAKQRNKDCSLRKKYGVKKRKKKERQREEYVKWPIPQSQREIEGKRKEDVEKYIYLELKETTFQTWKRWKTREINVYLVPRWADDTAAWTVWWTVIAQSYSWISHFRAKTSSSLFWQTVWALSHKWWRCGVKASWGRISIPLRIWVNLAKPLI